jgi:hypothetical protein
MIPLMIKNQPCETPISQKQLHRLAKEKSKLTVDFLTNSKNNTSLLENLKNEFLCEKIDVIEVPSLSVTYLYEE